jgi:hypothetical protein
MGVQPCRVMLQLTSPVTVPMPSPPQQHELFATIITRLNTMGLRRA